MYSREGSSALADGAKTIDIRMLAATANERRRTDDPALYNRILKSIPFGRLGEPEEVAGALVFLAGEGASFITGQVLGVDGGFA